MAPLKKVAQKQAAPKKSTAKQAAPKKAAARKTITTISAPKPKSMARRSADKPSQEQDTAMLNDNFPETPQVGGTEPPVSEPTRERDDVKVPVEEPTISDTPAEAQGSPIPKDLFTSPGDSFHGQTKATRSKSTMRPSGKKPLWNK